MAHLSTFVYLLYLNLGRTRLAAQTERRRESVEGLRRPEHGRRQGRPSTRTKIEGEGLLLPPAPASRSEPTQQQQNEQNGLTPRRWFYNGSWQVSKFDQSFKVARPHPFRRRRNFRWTGVGYNAPQCLSTAGRFTGLSSDFVLHKLPWGFRETICILSNSTTPRLRRYRT